MLWLGWVFNVPTRLATDGSHDGSVYPRRYNHHASRRRSSSSSSSSSPLFLKPQLQPQTGLSLSLVSSYPPVATMASILHSSGLSTTVVNLHPLINTLCLQCFYCGARQWINLPSDSVHRVRFFLAEGPPAKCERCCRRLICRIRADVHNFLHAVDNIFNNTTGGGGSPIYQ